MPEARGYRVVNSFGVIFFTHKDWRASGKFIAFFSQAVRVLSLVDIYRKH